MREWISTIRKSPGSTASWLLIRNDLKTLQQEVGGRIETTTLMKDLAVVSNADMIFSNLPFNCSLCGVQFFGTILLVGTEGEELTNPPVEVDYGTLFPQLWRD